MLHIVQLVHHNLISKAIVGTHCLQKSSDLHALSYADRYLICCTMIFYSQISTFSCTTRIDIYHFHECLLHLIDVLVAIYLSQFLLLVVVF